MSTVIGIVPSARLFSTPDPYDDRYTFINLYTQRLCANGAVPIGILAQDGLLPPGTANLCDGFLLCGGSKLWPYHLQVLHHALKTGKPVLGICLGMQAINAYFRVCEQAEKRQFSGDPLILFEQMKQEKFLFTLPVAHHWDVQITRDNIELTKHPIFVRPGTLLHRLTGVDCLRGSSMHHYRINGVAPSLCISAQTADGTIEAIEYSTQMLGVQFHPEVDDTMDVLFEWLIRAAKEVAST